MKHWWKIERYECSLVGRDRKWWLGIQPKLIDFWEDVEYYRRVGIQELLDNCGNKPIITFDDDASLLVGMPINVYIHDEYSPKDDRDYARIWNEPAPIIGEGEHLTFTEKDVSYWKKSAENGLKRWNEKHSTPKQSTEGNASAPPF